MQSQSFTRITGTTFWKMVANRLGQVSELFRGLAAFQFKSPSYELDNTRINSE